MFALTAIALTVGLVLTGCPQETKEETKTASLNGTWVYTSDGYEMALILSNGNFEVQVYGDPESKGTYSTSGNTITITTTHKVYTGPINSSYPPQPGLYTKDELQDYINTLPEGDDVKKYLAEHLDGMYAPQTATYSLNGNTLIITYEGGQPTTLTRRSGD